MNEYNGALEKYFIIVQWEQPWAGKSYSSKYKPGFINADALVENGLEVVSYLKARFKKDKIYLVAHCMGSILGITMIRKQPSDFIAYVGISQHAYLKENLAVSYKVILDKMTALGNTKAVAELEAVFRLFTAGGSINCFSACAEKDFEVYGKWLTKSGGFFYGHTTTPKNYLELFFHAPEYTLYEKLNLEKGTKLLRPLAENWYDLNFKEKCLEVKVPVLFIMGKNDYHVISGITQSWFEMLAAPEKNYVVFQNSAHFPHFEEPSQFNTLMKKMVLKYGDRCTE